MNSIKENKMDDYSARDALRKGAGARIDPATAEVWIEYAWLLDPYGDFPDSPNDYTFAAMRRVFADADAIGGT